MATTDGGASPTTGQTRSEPYNSTTESAHDNVGHSIGEPDPQDIQHHKGDPEKVVDEKRAADVHAGSDSDSSYDVTKENHYGETIVVSDAKELITHVLHVEDDPSLSPWTFRAFFIGLGLGIFAAVLQTIYYFKPQAIYVSVVFLTVIAHVIGEAMAFIPRWGPIGRFLNPFPFNSKEHAFIVVMASAGATSAVAMEILAAQKLYYNESPNAGAAIFLVISSQLIGYGIAGLMREILVQPSKMLWPINIPVNSVFEMLHRDRRETWKRLRVFLIIFAIVFCWEIVPEWMFPLLQGVSIFCLAHQNSLVFTNLFGGVMGNEGLGFGSISFDWQYIASLGSPMWVPLYTLTNSFIGYILCICLYMALYYSNTWSSQDFPFMSQLLFDSSSNFTNYVPYNLTLILNPDNSINDAAVQEVGIPNMTATYVSYLITTNIGITAAIVHMLLWNFDDIKYGWSWLSPTSLKKLAKPSTWQFWKGGETQEEHRRRIMADPKMDPHYKLMLQNGYAEVPNWWYGLVLISALVIGIATIYGVNSTLPWWGYLIANLIAAIFILFFGAQMGITGFQFNQQPVLQMLAGYMHPDKPLANMYFTVFGFNGVQQGQWLLRDLKLAQLAHLSPRATFTAQMIGTVVGAVFDYIMMLSIVTNQGDILTSIEGSNIWSGQNVQQYNTLALAWSMASHLFSVGGRYQWVTLSYFFGFIVPIPFYFLYKWTKLEVFRYLNLSIILWYMGWLFVGVNSSILSYFAIGFFAQFYLRRYKPKWFVEWNYLTSAAMDGGTQVIVFILSFAVFGGSGIAHDFPTWWGNNGGLSAGMNLDYCMYNPANG